MLGNVGPTDPAALPALADKDASVWAAAVLGLSKNDPAATAPLPTVRGLVTADPSPRVRWCAQLAVAQIQGIRK